MIGIPLSDVTPEILAAMLSTRAPIDGLAAVACNLPQSVITWLIAGERGLSSNAIVQHLTGYPAVSGRWPGDRTAHPLDPADLLRCMLLLDACPELHQAFVEHMGSLSPVWARLVPIWDDLCEQLGYEMAVGDGAPATYDAMQAAIEVLHV